MITIAIKAMLRTVSNSISQTIGYIHSALNFFVVQWCIFDSFALEGKILVFKNLLVTKICEQRDLFFV